MDLPGARQRSGRLRPENTPDLELTDVIGTDDCTAVLAEPGATVRITVPELVDVAEDAEVVLSMVEPSDGDEGAVGPTSTASPDGPLTATVADGVVEVVLPPAEDLELDVQATGVLRVAVDSDVVDLPDGAVAGQPALYYTFDSGSGRGAAAHELEPVLVVGTYLGDATAVAGQPFDLVLPEDSRLGEVGVTQLEPVVVALLSGVEQQVPAPAVELRDDRTARVTVPSGTEAGEYGMKVVLAPRDADGVPFEQVASTTTFTLEVAAAPAQVPAPPATEEPTTTPTAAPTRPATNPGLRSSTGVEEAGTGREGLLVSGGLVLVAAVGATALAARRRSAR